MTADVKLGPIGQISRQVSDIAKAVDWYTNVLGLPHLYTYGDLAFFDCGGTRLFLARPENDGALPESQSVLYFRVTDISAAHATLAGRGVEFIQAPHMIFRQPDGTEEWLAFFRDLDGGILALISQVKSSTP